MKTLLLILGSVTLWLILCFFGHCLFASNHRGTQDRSEDDL